MSKTKARVFVPLTKVDEEQRLVYGTITQEITDKSGEVMDYATSKPFFEKWSGDIHEASGGLSKGNVRVMHGLVAAGKLTELDFNDEDQTIEVCAKIVDEGEWNKVVEGVYTGFSVGGKYEKKWTETVDGEKIKKYTAGPNEVSLVDNPCVPSATFTMMKADGAEEQVEFQVEHDADEWPLLTKADEGETTEEAPVAEATTDDNAQQSLNFTPTNDQVVEKATQMAKAADDGTSWMDHVQGARDELVKAATGLEKTDAKGSDPAEKGKAKKPKTSDGGDTTDHGDKDKLGGKGTEAKGTKTKKDGKASADRAADGNAVSQKVTAPGIMQKWTCSDGTGFEKKADAEAHEEKLAKGETEADKLRRMLKAVTEGVGIAEIERVPDDSVFGDLDRLHKAFVELDQPREADGTPKLEKGMYTVSRFARMIGDVAELTRTIKAEGILEPEDGENDDEKVSDALKTSLSAFGDNFLVYAKEQVAELLKGIDTDCSPVACYDYYYRAAGADARENTLAKDCASLIEAVKDDLGDDYAPTEETLAKRAPVVIDEEGGPLQKRFETLTEEHEDLRKVATEAIEQLGGLAKRVKELEDTPLPRAPRNVIGKDGDQFLGKAVGTDADKMNVLRDLLETHGADGVATMMIKAAHSAGGQQLHLREQ